MGRPAPSPISKFESMSEFLFQYEKVNPISWAYLSSLLMIALFFQFNRFWSVRNLDLVLLILLAPGLLMVNQARQDASATSLAAAFDSLEPAIPDTNVSAPAGGERGAADLAVPGGASDATSRRHMAYVGYLWLF